MSRFQRLTETMHIRQPYGVTVHIGEIAISKNGNPYPKAIDHFRFDGMFAERCQRHYPGKPNVLHVCFPKADPEQTCLITQEGALNGAPLTRSYFEWSKGGSERYETFDYKTQQWTSATEEELTAAEQSYADYARKTPKTTFAVSYNMRLSFWLVELMAEGVDCLCQLNTKADDSSIPAILHILEDAHKANRLQMYPYELSVEMVTGKGLDTKNEMTKKEYPVLRLGLMGSPVDLQRQQQAIDSYLQIRRILPFSEQLQHALANTQKELADSSPKNALNAAPPEAIDAEHVEVTNDESAINEEIMALVERGNLLIQQSGNPQIESWWNGVLATQDLEKVRGAIAWMEKKAAEKAALKPEHLEPVQPADVFASPPQEG